VKPPVEEGSVTPEDEAVVARVLNYPMDTVMARYRDEYNVPVQLAAEHELALKRYLALTIINPSGFYGMRGPVDDLWHTFILFTKEYARFCEETAGCFIHHDPVSMSDEGEMAKSPDEVNPYLVMLRDYEAVFGEPPPPHIWPRGIDLRVRVTGG
jgi:hypothetical protein